MQIADILSSHVAPGAVVFDLTGPVADLSSHAQLPPQLGLTYRIGRATDAGERPAVGLVLQHLPTQAVPGMETASVDLDVANLATRVIHVVFFDRAEVVVERGLLEDAAQHGWELAGIHATGHPVFRFAAVLVAHDEDAASPRARLRVLNEFRFDRFLLRDRERVVEHAKDQLRHLHARVQELEAAAQVRDAELASVRTARAEAVSRLERSEAQLATARQRLARARGSLSFRLGRATRVAMRELTRDPLGVPRRWLATFRGRDEQLDLET